MNWPIEKLFTSVIMNSCLDYPEKASDAVRPLDKNGWGGWSQENSYSCSRRVIGKGRQDVLTPLGWPQWRKIYHPRTSVWKMPRSFVQATVEFIGGKQSYALKWCKLNNDDDNDNVIMTPHSSRSLSACCWSNVVPSTAVCIVIRSCGASNTSFIAWLSLIHIWRCRRRG